MHSQQKQRNGCSLDRANRRDGKARRFFVRRHEDPVNRIPGVGVLDITNEQWASHLLWWERSIFEIEEFFTSFSDGPGRTSL